MASSNRHWPSMFKSKSTSNPSLNQWSHDLMNSQDDERTPEPKPRWNPRPEQIRILESIFNSGTTNPPRDEIRRIRAQLQEFGQVGDANVFYWFQNRKSRSKHKQRHLQPTKPRPTKPPPPPIAANSSSSSDKSIEKPLSINPSTLIDLLNSPTMSVNQPFLAEPYFLAAHDNVCGSSSRGLTNGICFPDLSENLGNSSVLIGDAMQIDNGRSKKSGDDQTMIKLPTVLEVPGLAEPAPLKSTVFINDVCFEVAIGVPFNVREAFGDDAVLIHSAGQPVPTDEWGVTRQPLQHGGFYYLLRSSTTKPLTW